MSRTNRIAARTMGAVAVVALGLSLGACSGGSAPAAAPSESVSATASPSPTELSPEEEAIAQAEPLVSQYFQMKDEAMQDPAAFRHQQFEKVAIGTAQNDLKRFHGAAGEQGLHQTGVTEIVSLDVDKVDLTFNPKVTPPEIPYVDFNVCYDVTNLDTVDEAGDSIIPADRKDRGVIRVGVANYDYPDGPWLVAYTEYLKDKSC
ncbi:hypothetical protein ACFO6V_14350 [Promicromonospora alba]|uniref:Secreted protein n=1 Tax=Promicromonospora alba TaxID=1616110 RepID=A0ABV9HGZ0_9MICO